MEEYKRRADNGFIYICERLALTIIINCKVATAVKFRTKSGFNQYDIMVNKEQSVLTKTIKLFAKEEILLQHFVLNYKIDLYFPRHKLAIEVDEKEKKKKKKREDDKRQEKILIVN